MNVIKKLELRMDQRTLDSIELIKTNKSVATMNQAIIIAINDYAEQLREDELLHKPHRIANYQALRSNPTGLYKVMSDGSLQPASKVDSNE